LSSAELIQLSPISLPLFRQFPPKFPINLNVPFFIAPKPMRKRGEKAVVGCFLDAKFWREK